MENDLIRRSDAISQSFPVTFSNGLEPYDLDVVAVGYIKSIPAVDAVEVVRCRECKNWETDWMPDMFVPDPPCHYCAINDCFLTGDWFCAAGERIDVGDNK